MATTRAADSFYAVTFGNGSVTVGDVTLNTSPGAATSLDDVTVREANVERVVVWDRALLDMVYAIFKSILVGEALLIVGPDDSRGARVTRSKPFGKAQLGQQTGQEFTHSG